MPGPDHRLLNAQNAFLQRFEALFRSPSAYQAAIASGLEPVLEELCREACDESGVSIEEYARALELVPGFQDRQQQGLEAIMSGANVSGAVQDDQRAAVMELVRALHLLRFEHCGIEPPEWIWGDLPLSERTRVRAAMTHNASKDERLLRRVERALEKIDQTPEKFGQCEACAEAIPLERLVLVPYAERCFPCQARIEPSNEAAGSSISVTRW